MSVPSSLLRIPVEMPNRSGFNLSHSNCFTGKTGTLIPVLCHELLPNDTVSLGSQLQVQLPPMVTDFYGRVDFVLEAFFVPNRLLWAGWKDFITHPTANPQYPAGTPVQVKPLSVPTFYSGVDPVDFDVPVDSLLHYLDYGSKITRSDFGSNRVSALRVLAYHRIWDDWYRDSRVQSPLFYPPHYLTDSVEFVLPSVIPYLSSVSDGSVFPVSVTSGFSDGVSLTSLRQRNWVKDYFTTASPLPQAGGASEVKFDISSATQTGAFSISTLRSANSLQKWMERNNIAGYRYSDQIYAQFGVYPSDAIMDRCLYLGRHVQTVYNRSVFSTINFAAQGSVLGTKAANSQALGEGSLVDGFTASEHGYLMVLASLVPRPVYGSGTARDVFRVSVGDFAFPLLAGMGDQAILQRELTGGIQVGDGSAVFGYTDLYAEYKFLNDKVHGLLRDGQDLDSYVLQRSFDVDTDQSRPVIGTQFLQIPTDYLDQVQAIKTSAQGYTYWAEVAFPFKKISTLPAYSQPTLADLSHAHTEYISRGGKRL